MKNKAFKDCVKYVFITKLLVSAILVSHGDESLRIMPVGDSITRGTYMTGNTIASELAGGYRKPLQDALRAAGVDYEFVGELDYWAYGSDGVVDPLFDPDHHGLAGFSNTGILNGGVVPTPAEVLAAKGVSEIRVPGIVAAIETNNPDVVLLMSGANGFNADARDLLIQSICNNYTGKLYVASITPQKEPRSGWEQVPAYNASLPGYIETMKSQGYNIHYVNMYAALTDDDITADGVHPTYDGLAKIADTWFQALLPDYGVSSTTTDVDIYADIAGGTIHPGGWFTPKEVIAGVGVPANNQFYNGVSFFQLPTNRILAVDMILTVHLLYGSWPTADAAIDLWGLGYVKTPVLNSDSKAWTLMADTDAGKHINTYPYEVQAEKIADDLVGNGQTVQVGDVFSLNLSQQAKLLAFINSLYAKGAQPGDYAVFRVNPDASMTSSTGVSVRFGGTWSTVQSPDRRGKMSVTLSDEPAPTAAAIGFQHFSHANDGSVFVGGSSSGYDLISGTFAPEVKDSTGIAFIPLPEQPLSSITFALSAVTVYSQLNGANLDVWGLGYWPAGYAESISVSPTLNSSWHCTNNVDSRILLNNCAPVKLADNIVTSGQQIAVGNIWQPDVDQQENIVDYLNGLYSNGAKPGDFAVLRINMDASQADEPINRSIRWGGSHRTNPDQRAYLAGLCNATTNYLVNPGFESGSGGIPSGWSIDDRGFLGERTTGFVRTSAYAFKMSVNGNPEGSTQSNLNISQSVYSGDFAGKLITLNGYVRHNTDDPLVSGSAQKVEIRLYWIGGAQNNTWATSASSHNLLPTDLKDAYKPIYLSVMAPEDITGVKAMVIFRSGVGDPSVTSGTAFVDDMRLTVFEEESEPAGTFIIVL